LEVFGSPARTPAYLGSHVVHGPASENLHNFGSYRTAAWGSASPREADMPTDDALSVFPVAEPLSRYATSDAGAPRKGAAEAPRSQ